MDKNQEYCILPGEFARLCNTTRDTLRYYEQQGILVPYQRKSNGYHYYSYAQMASFYFIMIFRHLGCSVAEIQNYLLGGQEARFDLFLDRQYEALLAERRELDRKIAMVTGTRELLSEIRDSDVKSPVLRILPKMMRLKVTPVTSFPATSMGEIQADIRKHLESCDVPGVQMFPMGAVIATEDFLKGNYTYKQVFSFLEADTSPEDVYDRMSVSEQEQTKSVHCERGMMIKNEVRDILNLAGQRAAVCVCKDSDGDIRDTYRGLADFLTSNDLKPCSDVYSLSIVNVIDPHEMRRYLKYLFVCV